LKLITAAHATPSPPTSHLSPTSCRSSVSLQPLAIMDAAQPANAVNISVVLAGLDPPGTDQYLVALGPGSQQFCGTPNGYCAYAAWLPFIKSI